MLICFTSYSQDWTWLKGSNTVNAVGVYGTQGISSTTNTPGARFGHTTWVDANGNIWLFGGRSSNSTFDWYADLWKYSPVTNQWTWVKGVSTMNYGGIYGTQGLSSATNSPGARHSSVGWTDNQGNLWMFGGSGYAGSSAGGLSDLWKYNIATNQWTWMKGSNVIGYTGNYGTIGVSSASNAPGSRNISHGFYFNDNLFLFGGNGSTPTSSGSLNDMWKYSIATNQWTWIKGSNVTTSTNIFGTLNVETGTNSPCGRQGGAYTTDGNGNFYFLGGEFFPNIYYSDLWRYNAVTNNWTWIKGPSSTNILSVIGTQGQYAQTNYPGSRCSATMAYTDCGLFFHGGYGVLSSSGNIGYDANDLWQFSFSNNNWRFLKGTTSQNQGGIYGVQGTSNPSNYPGSRQYGSMMSDQSGNIWLFGGSGRASNSTFGVLNDLWKLPIGSGVTVTSPNSTTICSGATLNFSLTASSSNTFTWQATANPNVTGETTTLTTGSIINNTLVNTTSVPQVVTYTVTPTSTTGCAGQSQTVSVTVNPKPIISSYTMTICSGQTFNISPANSPPATIVPTGTTYNWVVTNNSLVNGDVSGTGSVITGTLTNTSSSVQSVLYSVTPIGPTGCLGQSSLVTINVQPSLIVNAGPDQTVCFGTPIVLSGTGSGATNYSWSNGVINNSSFVATASGVYTFTGSQTGGCTASDQLQITVLPAPIINAGPNQTICSGSSITLSATGGVSYQWNGGVVNGVSFQPTVGINSYTVIGTGVNGCTASDQVTVTVNSQPQVNAGPDITICLGDSVVLSVPVDTTSNVTINSQSGIYVADYSTQPYSSTMQVTGFSSGSTITNAGDLNQICMNIEHSYLGDLDIWLQCPNGQIAPLVNAYTGGTGGFLPGGISGGGVFLGDPIDDVTGPPGDGWQYCFSSVSNTSGTLLSNIFNTLPLSFSTGNNSNGFSIDPAPIYLPESSFSSLIGCPVNGNWTILIQDEWQIDDGYLFDWSLNFSGSLNNSSISSAQWNNNVINGIPFAPISSGTYTVTVTSPSGCISTDNVNVTLLPASQCAGSSGGFNNASSILPFSIDNFIPTVIDHNNDGIDDVFGHIMHQPNSNKLWINNGNSTFTDISTTTNFPTRNNGNVIDLDKNGKSDIYYIVGDTVFVHYNMNGVYQSATGSCSVFYISSLFGISSSSIRQVQFADYNNDGVYDLLVQVQNGSQSQLKALTGSIGCQSNCPYSLGNNISNLLSINTLNSVITKLADLDNDFDMDIMLSYAASQYQNATYLLFQNNGNGIFTQLTGSSYQMGRTNAFATVGELNNDGIPDIISGAADCCVPGDPLYAHLSNGLLNYTVSTTAIPRYLDPYYGQASLVDLNLDSRKDIVWVGLAAIGSEKLQYHVNNGNGTFTESSALYNIHEGPSTGQCCPIRNFMNAAVIDINNDFKPDLSIRELDNASPYTFVNDWIKINNTSNNSVKIKLDACVGLKEGWGARLKYKAGGMWYHQQHTAYTQDNYPFLYLGMGSNTQIDSLQIFWIGGNVTTLTNVISNQYLSISETPFCSLSSSTAQVIPNNNQSICSNDNYELMANVQNLNGIQWFLNGQTIAGANDTTLIVNASGNYSFIANNGSLCNVASDTVSINVLPTPNVQINPLTNDSLCDTQCAFILASGADQYSWFNGSTLNYTGVYNTGSYSVIGYSQNGCQDTAFIQMYINSSTDTTIFVTALDSYQFYGQTLTQTGVYFHNLTNSIGCDSTIILDLDLSFTGIDEQYEGISIYPNPVSDNLMIESKEMLTAIFEVTDGSGRIVLSGNLEGTKTQVSFSTLAIGCYMLRIGDLESKIKIIKQ